MKFLRTYKLWLPLLFIVVLLTACSGGGSKYYTVSGTVQDRDGTAISKVVVQHEGEINGMRETSSNGHYKFTGLRGEVVISAYKEGWIFDEPKLVNKASVVDFTGERKTYPLWINVTGNGRVREQIISSAQSTDYDFETRVQLEAIPDPGWFFSHWEDDLSGEHTPAIVTVLKEMEVTAVFESYTTVTGTIKVEHEFPKSIMDQMSMSAASSSPKVN